MTDSTECNHQKLSVLNGTFCVKCGHLFAITSITQDLLDERLNK